ncbi:MAG: hypothetical protein AAFX87_12755 [Bacteroidota bacterium]
MLRPMRDEMAITFGVENLYLLFLGSFLVVLLTLPIVQWLHVKFKKTPFAIVTVFTALLLFISFLVLNEHGNVSQLSSVLFIWINVFNLLGLSMAWHLLGNVVPATEHPFFFTKAALGITVGTITGPILVQLVIATGGSKYILLWATVSLFCSLYCSRVAANSPSHLSFNAKQQDDRKDHVSKPNQLSILGLFVFLYASLSTFLYLEQAHIISSTISDPQHRVSFFAFRDLATSIMAILVQVFVTKKLIKSKGIIFSLMIIPAVSVIMFAVVGFSPSLLVVTIVQVCYRAGNAAIQRPSREIIFTRLERKNSYTIKGLIDTTVYRGGDAASSLLFQVLKGLGFNLSALAFTAVPLAIAWLITGYQLGKDQKITFTKLMDHETANVKT